MDILQPIAAILLVFGLLSAALYFLKKKKVKVHGGGGHLEILERISLGPNHSISLIRVGAKTMLVATSPATCQVTETDSLAGVN